MRTCLFISVDAFGGWLSIGYFSSSSARAVVMSLSKFTLAPNVIISSHRESGLRKHTR
jgi:hypothetical protein